MERIYICSLLILISVKFGVFGQSNKKECNFEEESEIISQIRTRLKRLEALVETRQDNCRQVREKASDKETKSEDGNYVTTFI